MNTTDETNRDGAKVRVLAVDTTVYGMTAILKAAYSLTARAYLHLQHVAPERIEVRISPKDLAQDPDQLAGDFLNDLIDQRLREIVSAETQAARDLILTHALSKTNLLSGDLEHSLPREASANGTIRPSSPA